MSTLYLTHGVTLALAWFILANALACALVAAWPRLRSESDDARPAGFWLAMRLLPAAAATIFVAVLFVPSYIEFEPRETTEGFDITLVTLAATTLAIVGVAAVRTVLAWRRVARQTNAWMRHATPLALDGTNLPAYAVEADQPVIALVGLVRPTLLVTRGLLDALTPAELAAAVAHEVGHQHAFDNLKRLAMCAAPDLLRLFGTAKPLERRWAAAAEHVADRAAGRHGADARCALASALVKVARLTTATPPVLDHVSTLIGGGEIAARVRRLLADGEPTRAHRASLRIYVSLAVTVAALALAYRPALEVVHEVSEVLVRVLP